MSQTTQYFFSIEKLRLLLKDFDNGQSIQGGRTLRGFVFTPGTDPQTDEPRIFPFPFYSLEGKDPTEDGIIVQNLSMSYSTCPYPPPCK